MPITQARMVALANAGADFQQAYEQTWTSIQAQYNSARGGEITWEQALTAVLTYNAPRLRITNFNSSAAIATELAHFKSQRGRNNRAAKSARKKRAEARGLYIEEMGQNPTEPLFRQAVPSQPHPMPTPPQLAHRPDPYEPDFAGDIELPQPSESMAELEARIPAAVRAQIDAEIRLHEEQEEILAKLGQKPKSELEDE